MKFKGKEWIKPHPESHFQVTRGRFYVNGYPFRVMMPDEPIKAFEDGKLVTIFRGHLTNYWTVNEIEGYYE